MVLRISSFCLAQLFFVVNSFCIRVTAKWWQDIIWWQKWVIIFCCQQFPSEKTYWHLITHHAHFPCHFSFKTFQNFLIIALFPLRFFSKKVKFPSIKQVYSPSLPNSGWKWQVFRRNLGLKMIYRLARKYCDMFQVEWAFDDKNIMIHTLFKYIEINFNKQKL